METELIGVVCGAVEQEKLVAVDGPEDTGFPQASVLLRGMLTV